ncbi:MAG: type II toxin-antitoxin system VapC family toxin [Fibromonadaceae bacterium]|jgi:predicted nucleic acid-binding protein|nr:type II toxin-antitoxin system VapC family toxin [Fibromonadaceae bacterium]
MKIVDTSLWIEFFAGTELDESILNAIKKKDELYVPVICLYEVRKKFVNDNDIEKADLAVEIMKIGKIIDVDSEVAVLASSVSKQFKLPMADSIIYATAKIYNAEIYTQDRHFENLENVHYFVKMDK